MLRVPARSEFSLLSVCRHSPNAQHLQVTRPARSDDGDPSAPGIGSTKVNAASQAELNDLLFHWSEAYYISYDEPSGRWRARYKAASDELTGLSSAELRQAIRVDYPERRMAEQRILAAPQERSSI
jgi:hypothetical protein